MECNLNVDNSASKKLPDLQHTATDFPKKYISKVGVTNLELPISILVKGEENPIPTVAVFRIFVDLESHRKGINMSRINVSAHSVIDNTVSAKIMVPLLDKLKEQLECNRAEVEISFTYFIKKKAPVTDYYGYVPYKCSIRGVLENGKYRMYQSIQVVYTSLCPCSKEISDYSAHNQPSYGTLTVEMVEGKFLWFEDMVRLIEDNASSEMYSILKRVDEKAVTERAYDNPIFVEDIVRRVAVSCDKLLDDVISDYKFYTEHRESIHVSWATGEINAGREL